MATIISIPWIISYFWGLSGDIASNCAADGRNHFVECPRQGCVVGLAVLVAASLCVLHDAERGAGGYWCIAAGAAVTTVLATQVGSLFTTGLKLLLPDMPLPGK